MRGLDGSNGVIIPKRNARNLVLSEDVREAVEKGLFNIYTIDRMEEGLEILNRDKGRRVTGGRDVPRGYDQFSC